MIGSRADTEDRPDERARLILDLRRNGIADQAVLEAIEKTPRWLFIPETFQRHAHDDSALPIGRGQTISQPLVVAMMTSAMSLHRRAKVLEIGTGSGYQAAILARLSRRVYTIERHRLLLREAEARFRTLDLHNIVTQLGDGMKGWPGQAPFDRIMVTAAATEVPGALVDQLGEGGVMVIPVGRHEWTQTLLRLERTEDGLVESDLGGVRFVPLLPGVDMDND
jgi:protein-L-isoaspartate(D-aspartate) O-methyltransferase